MQQIGSFTFRKMDTASVREIANWRYEAPYDIYNASPDEIEEHIEVFMDPQYRYYTVWNEADELIAFRCFGEDAQVPGGDYSTPALDMGGGLRPDLTGKGLGARVMEAAFAFAQLSFAPKAFRATVAAFNTRALRVCEKVGYRPVQTFWRPQAGREYVVLMRAVDS